jgi:hypothetical protein
MTLVVEAPEFEGRNEGSKQPVSESDLHHFFHRLQIHPIDASRLFISSSRSTKVESLDEFRE